MVHGEKIRLLSMIVALKLTFHRLVWLQPYWLVQQASHSWKQTFTSKHVIYYSVKHHFLYDIILLFKACRKLAFYHEFDADIFQNEMSPEKMAQVCHNVSAKNLYWRLQSKYHNRINKYSIHKKLQELMFCWRFFF